MQARSRLFWWSVVHKWSALICTGVLLLLCLTGLPLIFHEEIEAAFGTDTPYPTVSRPRPVDLDELVARSRKLDPSRIVTQIFLDDHTPQIVISMASDWHEAVEMPLKSTNMRFDARSGERLEPAGPPGGATRTMAFIERLHSDLLLEGLGEIVLAVVAVLFLAAIVSGVVLYGPFTRRLAFGAVRTRGSSRLRWLDLHNLLGITTLLWALVVGGTGAMNAMATPLFAVWQRTELAHALDMPTRKSEDGHRATIKQVYAAAQKVAGPVRLIGIVFPGAAITSPNHYLVWARGQSPMTARLLRPIFVDASSGQVTKYISLPWYLTVLQMSRPLHFGDYGGMPLKIIWALLDLVTIVVLGSGLYLWIARPRRERSAAGHRTLHGASPAIGPAE